MIDSCENKDKIYKSRAEYMALISEQSKFNIDEEFKKICIKERENILRKLYIDIKEEAEKGYRELEVTYSLFGKYESNEFKIITNSVWYDNDDIFKDYWCGCVGRQYIHNEYYEKYPYKYIDKFLFKLSYSNMRKIEKTMIYDWIICKLKEENFNVKSNYCFNNSIFCTIKW